AGLEVDDQRVHGAPLRQRERIAAELVRGVHECEAAADSESARRHAKARRTRIDAAELLHAQPGPGPPRGERAGGRREAPAEPRAPRPTEATAAQEGQRRDEATRAREPRALDRELAWPKLHLGVQEECAEPRRAPRRERERHRRQCERAA